jgi:hypothetical protein
MKKLFFILAVFISATTFAQSTSPRFGTVPGDDNTGRVITHKYVTLTDAVGADTVTMKPNASETFYRVSVVDSLYFASPNITRSYAGDKIIIVATGASGKKIKFAGTNLVTTGTATLSSGGSGVIQLLFNGAKWVEVDRTIQ